MEQEWVVVFSSTQMVVIEAAKLLLEENGIDSFQVNKKDSTYIVFGDIELFVHAEEKDKALLILTENDLL